MTLSSSLTVCAFVQTDTAIDELSDEHTITTTFVISIESFYYNSDDN